MSNTGLRLIGIKTLSEQIDQSLYRERMTAGLSSFFGAIAVLLACIGLYGVMAYSVSRRTNEIGVRMALGAQRVDVLLMVLRNALTLTGLGLAIGLFAAVLATRLIGSQLYGLGPRDPLTMLAATGLLLLVAALARYLPARRAAGVNPMVALRYE